MVTQQVTGAARLKLMTSSLVDMSLLPLHPQSYFFNSAFCKGNRVTLQPAKIQTAQNFGNLFGLAAGLAAILFGCEFFFLPFFFFFFPLLKLQRVSPFLSPQIEKLSSW